MRGQGARVIIGEVDPICALQAVMDGYQVTTIEKVVTQVDFFITGTGNARIITAEHLLQMKHLAVVANIGHFDNEIDMDGISRIPGVKKLEVKPQVHEWQLPNGNSVLILSEGRLMNLGNATGHPSFVMSTSFSNQVLAQLELFTKRDDYPIGVYILPKHLDEKVARLHLDALGVELTQLSKDQGRYIGVDQNGPFKPDHYRY
jgi:adenosylhomocysteinase